MLCKALGIVVLMAVLSGCAGAPAEPDKPAGGFNKVIDVGK
jgi:hypothetical protein